MLKCYIVPVLSDSDYLDFAALSFNDKISVIKNILPIFKVMMQMMEFLLCPQNYH